MAADRLTYPVKRAGDQWTHQEANSIKVAVNEHADELDALSADVTTIGNTVTSLNNQGTITQHTGAGTQENPVVIMPNTLNKWGAVTSLYVAFHQATYMGRVYEYMMEFIVSGNAFTLHLPSSVKWMEEPNFEEGWTYQVSIVNGLALYAGWEPAQS